MADMGIFDPDIGAWRALTPADLGAAINAENINLDLDPQALADAGNLAPDGSPAEGSANALLGAIKTAIEELEISGGGASAEAIDDALRATALAVSGPLTDAQLRNTAVPVSVSGVATSAAQTTGNNSLSSIDGKLPALVSSRVPVVVGAALPAGTNNIGDVDIASMPALPAGSNNIGDVDVVSLPALPAGSNAIGTVGVTTSVLPTGAATAAKQDDILAAINAGSVPVASLVDGNATNTDGSLASVIAAQGSGVATVLTDFSITNSSGSGVLVEIKNGSTTRWPVWVPPGGITHNFTSGLVGAANTAWNIDAAAATDTIYAAFSGFKVGP